MFKIIKTHLKEKTKKMKKLFNQLLITNYQSSTKFLMSNARMSKDFLEIRYLKIRHFIGNWILDIRNSKALSHFLTFSFTPLEVGRLGRLSRLRRVVLMGLSRFSLGLDIGTGSIKIARLVKTRRGVRLLNFWEKQIPREKRGEAGDEVIARTITELLSQTRPAPFTYSKCQKVLYRMLKRCGIQGEKKMLSSLSASSSVIKRLSLPFKGERKIRQVIRYEMEPFLPFSLEEAAIDFYITDDRLPNKTLVLAFAINKRVVERHLKILNLAGIRPEIVDLDSTSLFNVYFSKKDKETIALINLGAGQTIVNIISEEKLLFTRSILKAGDDITQSLAERLGIGFKEAEKLKREGLDKAKSKVIEPALDEIIKEVEYTLSSFLAFYPAKKIEKVLLTGGSSRLSGIDRYFQKNLNIETSLFNPFIPAYAEASAGRKLPITRPFLSRVKDFLIPEKKEISSNLDSATLEKTLPLLPSAMGIALPAMVRTRASLNFIREEKPLIKRLEEARPLLKPAVILLISILLLGLLDFYLHLYLKNKRSAKLKKEIRLVFKKTFPEVTNIVDPLVQMKDDLGKREEDLALSPREFSSLTILREISSLTPEDLGITIEDLSIDWDETRIRGSTLLPDFSLVDRFKKALEDSDYFTEVAVSDAHLGRKGKSVEFRITIKHGREQ